MSTVQADASLRRDDRPARPSAPDQPSPGMGRTPSGVLALSPIQQRALALQQIAGPDATGAFARLWRIAGELDVPALARAVHALIARHEPLRTLLAIEQGEAVGVLLEPPAPEDALIVDDLGRLTPQAREAALERRLADLAGLPFDLTADRPFRARLFRLGADLHVLALAAHESAADGWAFERLAPELALAYAAAQQGEPLDRSAPAVSYADVAAWARQAPSRREAVEAQVAWWREHLRDAPEVLSLPIDRPRDPLRARPAQRLELRIAAEDVAALRAVAPGFDPESLVTGVWAAALGRFARQEEVILGWPIDLRPCPQAEPLVGAFNNLLPLRLDLSGAPDAAALAGRVERARAAALAHGAAPFERLVEEALPAESLAAVPLLQAIVHWRRPNAERLELAGLACEPVAPPQLKARCEVFLSLEPQADGSLAGAIWYDASLFEAATIQRLSQLFGRALRQLAAAPGDRRPVALLLGLDPDERRQVLETFNVPLVVSDAAPCLPQLFEDAASRRPDAIAVSFDGAELSYCELEGRANRLARRLVGLGVGPETLVGVSLERGVELVVALLAVLKAGGAYLPLDPGYPVERLRYIVSDARPVCLLTCEASAGLFDGPQLRLDDPDLIASLHGEDAATLTQADRLAPLNSAHPAYVLYTSGSTGRPKGVVLTHHNVARLFTATTPWFEHGPDQVWTMFHAYGFDFSVWELWGALLHGGRAVVIDEPTRHDPAAFADLLARERVTSLSQTPSAFYALVEALQARGETLPALQRITFGGEALEFGRLRAWYDGRVAPTPVLENMYGPTECTVHSTCYALAAADAARTGESVIGRALGDGRLYVLDAHLQPAPIGVTGEIWVAGRGLSRGYLNRPGLTAERFIPDPFGPPGERMYRTGDLGRWRADGQIVFLGRADHQVKIRGFRIECGEIEVALVETPGVGRAAVLPFERDGDTQLVAYVTGPDAATRPPDAASLRAALSERLPAFMVPAVFVALDELPITANGKLDRRALPPPETGFAQARAGGRAPSGPDEERLARLFAKVLQIEAPAADESFFDLGGHSLKGLKLLYEIERAFGRKLPLGALFQAPTVEGLAQLMRSGEAASPVSLVVLHDRGQGPPIFFVHWIEHDLARRLGAERPVWGLSLGLAAAKGAPLPNPQSIESLAAHYIAEMRLAQPAGPYHLLGHSIGGVIAFEMARQLAQAGESVAFLALVDSLAPREALTRRRLPLGRQLRNLTRTPIRRLLRATYTWLAAPILRGPLMRDRLVTQRARSLPLRIFTLELLKTYRPGPYAARVDIFQAREDMVFIRSEPPPKPAEGWRPFCTGELNIHTLPGDHLQMVKDPWAQETARAIDAALAQTRRRGQRPGGLELRV